MAYPACMIIAHACTMIIAHACTMIIVHACTMIIVHARTMIIVHGYTMIILQFCRGSGGRSPPVLQKVGGAQPPGIAGGFEARQAPQF